MRELTVCFHDSNSCKTCTSFCFPFGGRRVITEFLVSIFMTLPPPASVKLVTAPQDFLCLELPEGSLPNSRKALLNLARSTCEPIWKRNLVEGKSEIDWVQNPNEALNLWTLAKTIQIRMQDRALYNGVWLCNAVGL